jgi:hypothetical protein
MLQKDHERFLELIVLYYNVREDWLENNTRANHMRYRKVLREMKTLTKDMYAKIQLIYREKLQDNKESMEKTGFIPKKRPPKDIDSISISDDSTKM